MCSRAYYKFYTHSQSKLLVRSITNSIILAKDKICSRVSYKFYDHNPLFQLAALFQSDAKSKDSSEKYVPEGSTGNCRIDQE